MDVILSVGHKKREQSTVYRFADGARFLMEPFTAAAEESISEQWY